MSSGPPPETGGTPHPSPSRLTSDQARRESARLRLKSLVVIARADRLRGRANDLLTVARFQRETGRVPPHFLRLIRPDSAR